MILRLFAQAILLVLIVALVSAFLDFEIVDVAVKHLVGGLDELVEIGKRLGSGDAGHRIVLFFQHLFSKV